MCNSYGYAPERGNACHSLSLHNRLVQPGALSLSPPPDQPASGFTPEFISCLRITDLKRRNIREGEDRRGREGGREGGHTQPKSREKSDDVPIVDRAAEGCEHKQPRANYCLNWAGNWLQGGT